MCWNSPQAIFRDPFRRGNNILVSNILYIRCMFKLPWECFSLIVSLDLNYRWCVIPTLLLENPSRPTKDVLLLRSLAGQKLLLRSPGINSYAFICFDFLFLLVWVVRFLPFDLLCIGMVSSRNTLCCKRTSNGPWVGPLVATLALRFVFCDFGFFCSYCWRIVELCCWFCRDPTTAVLVLIRLGDVTLSTLITRLVYMLVLTSAESMEKWCLVK